MDGVRRRRRKIMVDHWLCLSGAVLLEVSATSIMKISQNSSRAVAGMGAMYVLLGFSYFFLAKALLRIPVGVAFAFWEGIGLVLITLVSFFLVGEHFDQTRIFALGMIFAGVLLIHHGTESGETGRQPAASTDAGRAGDA
jgi:spermidine export protein MdtJ